MQLKNINVNILTVVSIVGIALAGSGGWWALAGDVDKNKDAITRIEQRTVAESNRIRDIQQKAAKAEAERQAIREQGQANGRKLDAILQQLSQ